MNHASIARHPRTQDGNRLRQRQLPEANEPELNLCSKKGLVSKPNAVKQNMCQKLAPPQSQHDYLCPYLQCSMILAENQHLPRFFVKISVFMKCCCTSGTPSERRCVLQLWSEINSYDGNSYDGKRAFGLNKTVLIQ